MRAGWVKVWEWLGEVVGGWFGVAGWVGGLMVKGSQGVWGLVQGVYYEGVRAVGLTGWGGAVVVKVAYPAFTQGPPSSESDSGVEDCKVGEDQQLVEMVGGKDLMIATIYYASLTVVEILRRDTLVGKSPMLPSIPSLHRLCS